MSKDQNVFTVWYAISFGMQLGFLIVLPIGGFMFLGKWVDGFLYTFPLFFLVGIIVGLFMTSYEIYHLLAPLIKIDG